MNLGAWSADKENRCKMGARGASKENYYKSLLASGLKNLLMTTILFLTLLVSYLLGAIPFGYAVARWRGVDILREGSGNIGATNVGRVLGSRFGILVFLLDFGKGALPVAAVAWLARGQQVGEDGLPVLAGLAAFVGHMFPVYLGFRGGKGVATGAGVVAVLLPGPALAALFAWIVVVGVSRYVSLASLIAVLVLCFGRLLLTADPFASPARTLTWFCFLAAGLVFARHRGNIVRLFHGTESQVHWVSPMFSKTIHVLALGLWFGSAAFLNVVVAPVIFQKFESLGARPFAEERTWLPLQEDFNQEKGKSLAGAAVAPLFDWFYPLEGMCGILVAFTALSWSWSDPRRSVHHVRSYLAVVALATVVAGWPIAQKVSALRPQRYAADPDLAAAAQAAFGTWHTYSLLLALLTLLLVTILMALAAQLPAADASLANDMHHNGGGS